VARVHALATGAGCQLVAAADLAVASENATFCAPGGRGGLFCTTPMVAIGRSIGRKRALEMSMSGEPIDAFTAQSWGLVNEVVPAADLESATLALLERVTRGSAESKGIGKLAFYKQIEMQQSEAYDYAVDVMSAASQSSDSQEGIAAFLEKRPPQWL
jgi:enoyl-CoA hydratase/carnithine racemase